MSALKRVGLLIRTEQNAQPRDCHVDELHVGETVLISAGEEELQRKEGKDVRRRAKETALAFYLASDQRACEGRNAIEALRELEPKSRGTAGSHDRNIRVRCHFELPEDRFNVQSESDGVWERLTVARPHAVIAVQITKPAKVACGDLVPMEK